MEINGFPSRAGETTAGDGVGFSSPGENAGRRKGETGYGVTSHRRDLSGVRQSRSA